MPQENDLLAQRRANMEALAALGVDLYPHEFERTDTVAELVGAHGAKAKAELEAVRVETKTSGRILAIRSFGKANFLVLSDGRARIQVYVREDALPGRDFKAFTLLDLGRLRRRVGAPVPNPDRRVHDLGRLADVPREEHAPLPEKWHGLKDVEIALPPALRGPDRATHETMAASSSAQPHRGGDARLPRRPRATSRSRRR